MKNKESGWQVCPIRKLPLIEDENGNQQPLVMPAVVPIFGSAECPVFDTRTHNINNTEFRRLSEINADPNNVLKTESIVHAENIEIVRAGTKENAESDSLSLVCNYYPQLIQQNVYLDRNGHVNEELGRIFIIRLLEISNKNIINECIIVKSNNLKKLATVIGEKEPRAMIYPDAKNANKIIENVVRSQVPLIKPTYIYCNAGWNKINGKMYYLHRDSNFNGINIETPYTLLSYQNTEKSAIKIVEKALDLYGKVDVARVLFLYSLTGVMHRLFSNAGYPIKFLLFVLGKSGSFKTSISKVLFTQLCKPEFRDKPRQIGLDTGVSFERALVEDGWDTTTLFDDFNPPKTFSAERLLKDNLEIIVRMIGDGSTKSRSNKSLGNIRGTGVHGTVVVTGELMGTGLSSNLRCLYCNINGNLVNKEVLKAFQNGKYSICYFIKLFADYLSQNWDSIISYISERYELYRNDREAHSLIVHERLIDSFATLLIISDVLTEFLLKYCGADSYRIERLFSGIKESILSIILASEAATEDEDPAYEFMKAFTNLISTGEIRLCPNRLDEKDLKHMDGFFDEQYIYILEKNFYKKTADWLNSVNISFRLGIKEIEKLLYQEHYLVAAPNGPNKLTYCHRLKIGNLTNKINFIKLRKDMVTLIQKGKNPRDLVNHNT